MMDFMERIPEKSVVVLQASAHHPTGCDLSDSEWDDLLNIVESRKGIIIADCAYQGLAKG